MSNRTHFSGKRMFLLKPLDTSQPDSRWNQCIETGWATLLDELVTSKIAPVTRTKLIRSAIRLRTGSYSRADQIRAISVLIDTAQGREPCARTGNSEDLRGLDEIIADLEAFQRQSRNPVIADILQELRQ